MHGYFGTPSQQRLQARVADMAGWIDSTPGACNSGRAFGCDDLDALGWNAMNEIVARDGALTFRLIPGDRRTQLSDWAAQNNFRVDFWDVFVAERGTVLAASDIVLSQELPGALRLGPVPREAEGAYIEAIHNLMISNGVAPYAGSFLAGHQQPAETAVVLDQSDAPIAVAFGHKPHNKHSAFGDYAYGGAVAVSPDHRARGLGKRVNALIAKRVLSNLGGTHFYEFVGADNEVSRRMVESCGLSHNPQLFGAIAVDGDSKFTR